MKYRSGKLNLPVPPRDWFEGILTHHNISVIPLDGEVCLRATKLPEIHKDPCDRFIIATAITKALPIVTADARFHEYGVEVFT